MANFIEILFLIHIFVIGGITLIKTINIFHKGEFYENSISWVLFFAVIIAWFLGLIGVLYDVTDTNLTLMFAMIFRFTSMLFLLNVVFLIIEIMLKMTDIFDPKKDAYNPKLKKPS